MFIGISGTVGSGRHQVLDFLRDQAFKWVSLDTDDASEIKLESIDDMNLHVTSRWQEDFVVLIDSLEVLEAIQRRPFFLHLSVDAPLKMRYDRWAAAGEKGGLDKFVALSDERVFKSDGARIFAQADISVINDFTEIAGLHNLLAKLDLRDKDRLRPTWDAYFMRLADLAALRSNCMKRRVGCVLVRENRVVSTGYNGTPRGLVNCNEGGCPRCNLASVQGSALNTCLCLHAEENALLEAGRDRIGQSAIIYCNTCPCLTCSIKIAQSGIREVVYSQSYSMDDDSARVFKSAGVCLRQFTAPQQGLA